MKYVSSYLTVGKNVCICSEKSGFCFPSFQLSWDTKQNKRSRNVVALMHYKAIVSGLEFCFFRLGSFSLLLILFLTESAIVSPDFVSFSIHRKYFTLECYLICISPYFIFTFLTFFILNLVAKRLSFVITKMDTNLIIDKPVTNAVQIFIQLFFNFINIFMLTYK